MEKCQQFRIISLRSKDIYIDIDAVKLVSFTSLLENTSIEKLNAFEKILLRSFKEWVNIIYAFILGISINLRSYDPESENLLHLYFICTCKLVYNNQLSVFTASPHLAIPATDHHSYRKTANLT